MKIEVKSLTPEFIMFSKEYFQLLGDNKTWDFPNITKHFRKITDSSVFMNNEWEKISQHLSHQKYIEINYKDLNKSLCPPGVVWVSNSGRFSCQRLDDFIDAQIFICLTLIYNKSKLVKFITFIFDFYHKFQ